MKNNIIGKYYKRKTSEHDYAVYKIIGFDGKCYIAIHYYLSIAYALRDNRHLLHKTFYKSPYFTEVEELDFSLAKNLYNSCGRYECDGNTNFRRT